MKKIMLLLIAMSFSGAAVAKTDKFNQCLLSLLNASCNTAIDREAPPNLRSEGADACFVGTEVAPKNSKEGEKFETWIEKGRLERNKEQSDAIRKCIATPASLKACTMPLIVATRNYYPVCKEAIEHGGKARKKESRAKTDASHHKKSAAQ